MAPNVSYASGDSELESLVLHTLPNFGEHGDGIINVNLLTAWLKKKNRIIVHDGALEFWKGVLKSENSNASWMGKSDDYTVNLQDPSLRLRWEVKVFGDTIVITELDEAKNKGRAAIKDFARTLRMQAESTIPNRFNSALWASSPGSNDPDSIPYLISTTPTTGTIGGASRVGQTVLQNGLYDTAIADIGSEAGIVDMTKIRLRYAITSGDMADLIILSQDKYANLQGYLASLNRYRPDDSMAKLDIETIKIGSATIGFENTSDYVKGGANAITTGYGYFINSKYLFLDVLKDGNFKWGSKFERVGVKPVKFLPYKIYCNLTTNLPRAHAVASSITA